MGRIFHLRRRYNVFFPWRNYNFVPLHLVLLTDTKTAILGLSTFPLNCLYCFNSGPVAQGPDGVSGGWHSGFLACQLRAVLMQLLRQTYIEHMSRFVTHEWGQQINYAGLKCRGLGLTAIFPSIVIKMSCFYLSVTGWSLWHEWFRPFSDVTHYIQE